MGRERLFKISCVAVLVSMMNDIFCLCTREMKWNRDKIIFFCSSLLFLSLDFYPITVTVVLFNYEGKQMLDKLTISNSKKEIL